jgi:hypothetical protein
LASCFDCSEQSDGALDKIAGAGTFDGMTITINATKGDADANSYQTLEEAEANVVLLAAMPFFGVDTSGFTAADEEVQKYALVAAADRIDTAGFVGDRMSTAQAREWPRLGTYKSPLEDTIPDALKLAQAAEACMLLSIKSEDRDMITRGVSSYSIGTKSVTFDKSAAGSGASSFTNEAREIMKGAGLLIGGVGSVYLPRG